jgi:catalase
MPEIPRLELPVNHSRPADAEPEQFEPKTRARAARKSPALSMATTVKDTVATRKVAILAADGADTVSIRRMKEALLREGAMGQIVAPRLGVLEGPEGDQLLIDHSLLTTSSVLFDAVYVPGGEGSIAGLSQERDALDFVVEAYRHCKPIAATTEGVRLLRECPGVLGPPESRRPKGNGRDEAADGVLTSAEAASRGFISQFLAAIAQHRFWERARKNKLGNSRGDETRGRADLRAGGKGRPASPSRSREVDLLR